MPTPRVAAAAIGPTTITQSIVAEESQQPPSPRPAPPQLSMSLMLEPPVVEPGGAVTLMGEVVNEGEPTVKQVDLNLYLGDGVTLARPGGADNNTPDTIAATVTIHRLEPGESEQTTISLQVNQDAPD